MQIQYNVHCYDKSPQQIAFYLDVVLDLDVSFVDTTKLIQ